MRNAVRPHAPVLSNQKGFLSESGLVGRLVRKACAVVVFGFLAARSDAAGGTIGIATQPAGATIYIDGQGSGKSPAKVDGLPPGRHFVRLELDGFQSAELVVELATGQNYQSPAIALIPQGGPVAPPPMPATSRAAPAPVMPVAAPPPPMAAPAPAQMPAPVQQPAAAPAPAPVADSDADETIRSLLAAHLKSITDGDVDAYLRLCAPKVDLYDEGMQGQTSIRKSREKLKDRWPVYEISNVRDVSVKAEHGDVQRATVTYDWKVSNPKSGKSNSGTANDVLDFKQTNGQWLIVRLRQNVDRGKSHKQ